MVNYSQAKVYKIVDNTNGNIYVGSTCEPTLARRLAGHVGAYKKYLNGKYHYVTSFKILENNDYAIVLLEACENTTTKDELHARERIYVEALDCVNKIVPLRTQKEYYETNKDILLEKKKEYYETNKDILLEKAKEYYETNKDILSEKKKEYYETNKDILLEKKKEYYKANSDKIKAYKKQHRTEMKLKKLQVAEPKIE